LVFGHAVTLRVPGVPRNFFNVYVRTSARFRGAHSGGSGGGGGGSGGGV